METAADATRKVHDPLLGENCLSFPGVPLEYPEFVRSAVDWCWAKLGTLAPTCRARCTDRQNRSNIQQETARFDRSALDAALPITYEEAMAHMAPIEVTERPLH